MGSGPVRGQTPVVRYGVATATEETGMITVEHVDFISIPTQDVPRAKRFYGELLGLPHEKDTPGGAEYRAGQVTLGIWAPADHGLEFTPNASGFALRVADVAEARRELEEQGVTFDGATFDTGVCHMALMRDPDGNQVILHRRYAP
jgi:predicted enzyme related to lactoylglutathione lyase